MKIKFLILIAVALLGSACSVNKLISDGDAAFSRKEFFDSVEKFRLANQKVKDKTIKPALYFKLAESYRESGDYTKAAVWYRNAIRTGYKDSTLEVRYADALRGAGKPDEAKLIYETELKKDLKNIQAINGMESIRRIQEWKEIPELYIVENLKTINSAANDMVVQINPESEKSIFIKSSREEVPAKKINPVTGQKFADFFQSDYDTVKKRWTLPELLTEPGFLNSTEDELFLNFSSSKELLVYSGSVSQTGRQAISQMLFVQKKNGQWTSPAPLQFTADGADYLHPMITENGKILWFASDRSGGLGGFDIWKSEIIDMDNFSEPINAGAEINTPGDEFYPFEKPNGYFNAQAKVSTRGLREAKEFEVDIRPIPINKPIRIDNINYELGKWELLPQAKVSLDKLAELLKLNPEAIIELSAHTDDIGDEKFNHELSEKRSASVVQYLTGKGIQDKSLKAKGYGESVPLKINAKLARQYEFLNEGDVLDSGTIEKIGSDNLKELARGLNRRTEFKVINTVIAK